MNRMRKVPALLLAAALVLQGFALPAGAGEDLDRCGAVTLEEKPPLGEAGNWDEGPYVRRHNIFLRERPEVFASGYLSGRHFYVGFTRDVCDNLRDFRRGLPQRWRVRAFEADFTYRRLRRAQHCVTELFGHDWLGISAVGVDVYRNKTNVMLERDTERRRRYIRRRCGASKGRILYFTEGTVTPE